MLKRTLTSIAIIVVVVGFFLLRHYVDVRLFNVLVLFMAFLSACELTRALGGRVSDGQKVVTLVFPLAAVGIATFFRDFIWIFSLLYIFTAIIWSSLEKEASLERTAFTLLAMFYPVVPLCSLCSINVMGSDTSTFVLASVMAISAFTDAAAYIFGSLIKGPKLCPEISPNKTISGAIGGLAGGVIASFAVYYGLSALGIKAFADTSLGNFTGRINVNVILFLVVSGLLLSFATQAGDIFESFIKRKLDIKDMGNIMPGHGGMLDRIDGLTFNSVIALTLYSFLA